MGQSFSAWDALAVATRVGFGRQRPDRVELAQRPGLTPRRLRALARQSVLREVRPAEVALRLRKHTRAARVETLGDAWLLPTLRQ
eukprot:CAMPEP_0176185970 /NCGR_PEP_ID=MMETSP0121_2-20121125/1628_1 /TAXON_ID=160619 /ORGANISM="Kryptoperidinium foliaceum, Strain CCMP 1326" /LENGTH=84 /DNA_ID=CAMNT_0017524439 /DNA_START=167 /DNA_END=418 /DNA_ORIENTATION=+